MNLYILDTDHVSLHQRNHPQIIAKLRALPAHAIAVSIVTVEEQIRGRFAQLSQPGADVTVGYSLLQATVAYFCDLNVLSFDRAAQQRYSALKAQRIRIGSLDLRIAAIALSHNAILVTANERDFRQVPGLTIENWA